MPGSTPRNSRNLTQRPAIIAAVVATVIHLAGNPHYGFYRDELYFIICGRHPALGYVDQPSLAPLLAALSQSFGLSLFLLRAIPAICAGLATYAACLFAAELGAGTFALVLTAIVVIVAPEMMAFGLRLSPDMMQFWTWPLIALLVLRISRGASPRLWLAIALLTSIAAWSKYTVLFFVFAMIAGVLLSPHRRMLSSRWFAGAALLTAALLFPNFWWQWHYGFPILQLLRNDYGKFLLEYPLFPIQQILIMNPLLSIVWIAGLVYLLRRRDLRFLGLAYVILIAVMWRLGAKSYYPSPIYPYLIAAGAIPIERWSNGKALVRRCILVLAIVVAIPSTPFVLPVLPIRTLIAYQQMLGRVFHIRFHTDTRTGNTVAIQYFADMTGWPDLTQTVARIYDDLPPARRAKAAIFAHNFGEASALQFFGSRYGLPPALSGNNNFWIWGPQGYSGDVLIDVNGNGALDGRWFRSVRLATVFRNPLAMPYENNLPIYVCTGIRTPLPKLWPQLRDYSLGFNKL